jgi:hypothetical protein
MIDQSTLFILSLEVTICHHLNSPLSKKLEASDFLEKQTKSIFLLQFFESLNLNKNLFLIFISVDAITR